ncbi:MAG: hydrogenase maturation nickel metallochaperone HypA [Prochloraceae cyanobacterium]
MHEVAIMEQTIEIAIDNASTQGVDRIHTLKMRVGLMSGVVPEALAFAFDVVTQNTIVQGANLEIETVPVTCYCSDCNTTFQPPDLFYECPECGKFSDRILSGKEIELVSIEAS